MLQLPAIVFLSALHAGLSNAQQYPLPVTYDTVIKSPVDPDITISYKTPDAHTCATAFDAQKQYTGYVNLPPSTLEPSQQDYSINTFFWFFEARENPEAAPLTIWLNGGPGASSMGGLFAEIGPCEVVEGPDGRYTTQPRVWGWDRSSNILFIDQPNQVGFSYDERSNASVDFNGFNYADAENRKEPSPLPADVPSWRFKNGTFASGISNHTEDLTTIAARSSWHFLQGFLSAFPQYNPGTRPGSDTIEPSHINLFAESYGGIYGPVFANYYENQNDRRKSGEIPAEALEIRLGSVGIVNGILDVYEGVASALKFAYNNTYGIEGMDLTTYQNAISELNADDGCRGLLMQCEALVALNDPEGHGTDADVNDLCAAALYTCSVTATAAYAADKSVYDIRVGSTVGPTAAFAEYLNEEDVLQSVGAPINFTSSSPMVLNEFNLNGDSARGKQIDPLADLLARGIKVALIYGDADVACNWYGGQNASLEIASLVPAYETDFSKAGYADIVVNDNHIGGAVRQYGNLSFSRIYDAGHQVPYYQPETAFTVFSRIIQGDDISMGRNVDLSSFGTEGPSTSDHTNAAGPAPESICWIRDAALRCTQEEQAAIAEGNGTVKAGIWYPTNEDVPTSASPDQAYVPKSEPIVTASVPLTGVYSATTAPTVKQSSGASVLRLNFPFWLSRRDIPAGLVMEEVENVRNSDRNIRNGLIGGLAAAAALLLGLISLLCCCRCFRRRREFYDGPFPDDGEKGPIVVKQVIDDSPALTYFGRPITHMEPIPEASPRPSDDIRDRAASIANKPLVPLPTAEEETFVPPVQRSTSISQEAVPTKTVPDKRPTEAVQPAPTPLGSGVVASSQRSMSVSVPPTPPLQTSTPPIKTPSTPPQSQLTPPVSEPTPSPGPVPTSVQRTVAPPSHSPLHTPSNIPTPPDSQPKIDTPPPLPKPSLFTRIKTMILPTPAEEDGEAAALTDGTFDRRVLLPRVAVRPSPQKRAPKAAVPNWSTEVWS